MKRDFEHIEVSGGIENKKLPILLISNHISWWDGFWALYLNGVVFKRKFHFMMLESQLRKYWIFNHIGGFSVNKSSKSVIESLQYTLELLEDKNNMVLIFPQGEIESMHQQHIIFEKGIEYILKHRKNEVQIVFLANFVDYFSQRKPSIYLYLSEFLESDYSISNINQCYNVFYKNCIQAQTKIPNK